jgi:hypothetical protein
MSNCSKSGNKYEIQIFNILKNVNINNSPFNTQDVSELGGSRSINDLICTFNDNSIGIEVKKCTTPDWMQCSIKFDNNKWIGSDRCKIPKPCRSLFNELIQDTNLFDGSIPPFVQRRMTHDEWINIKSSSTKWNDRYIDIPNDTILKLYQMKECKYIQISNYGLYHLGNDLCEFNVPEFIIDQQIRIRIKVHKKNNTSGFCDLSITASCRPKSIKQLNKSQFSLDDIAKLPAVMCYKV